MDFVARTKLSQAVQVGGNHVVLKSLVSLSRSKPLSIRSDGTGHPTEASYQGTSSVHPEPRRVVPSLDDGSFVSEHEFIRAADGSFVSGHEFLRPAEGNFVSGHEFARAADGSFVSGHEFIRAADGSFVSGHEFRSEEHTSELQSPVH